MNLFSTTLFVLILFLPQCAWAQCEGCVDNAVNRIALIYGVVFGIVGLITIICCIWAYVRWKRNRDFQRNYVRDAQARADALNQHNNALDNAMAAQYAHYPRNQYSQPSPFGGNQPGNYNYGDPSYGNAGYGYGGQPYGGGTGNMNYGGGGYGGGYGGGGGDTNNHSSSTPAYSTTTT